jgi:UDP-galactopyranose mutase
VGRLANYKYINMDEAIQMALTAFDDFADRSSHSHASVVS